MVLQSQIYRTKKLASPTPSSDESIINSVASLRIEETQPVTPVTPVETVIEKKETKKDSTNASEFDIFNSKVIACAIDNPEACEMCSG